MESWKSKNNVTGSFPFLYILSSCNLIDSINVSFGQKILLKFLNLSKSRNAITRGFYMYNIEIG